jgi:hypothetical protein
MGVVAVWEQDGKTMMIGSRNVSDWSLSLEVDADPIYDGLRLRSRPSETIVELNVRMYGGEMQQAEHLQLSPLQLPVYLPDMSFRALPSPEDKE